MRGMVLILVITALVGAGTGMAAERRTVLNPQVGITSTNYGDIERPGDIDLEEIMSEGRVGWMVGGFLRVGQRAYFQPGVFLQKTGVDVKTKDSVTTEDVTSANDVTSIWVPVQIGIDILESESMVLRANGGGAASFVTKVHDNDLGIVKDDYNSVWGGILLGAGVDLMSLITVDLSYEIGLTKVFKNGDTKANTARVAVGLRL